MLEMDEYQRVLDIVSMDGRTAEGLMAIGNALLNIQPMAQHVQYDAYGIPRVPISAIERLVAMVMNRYPIRVYMNITYCEHEHDTDVLYGAGINVTYDRSNVAQRYAGSVGGYSLYELWAKVCIVLWSIVQGGNVKRDR